MKENKYVCMWCDDEDVFQYVEFEDEIDLKCWFSSTVDKGFYNINIFERKDHNEG